MRKRSDRKGKDKNEGYMGTHSGYILQKMLEGEGRDKTEKKKNGTL